MPEYFPEESNEKPCEASHAIWADFDGFYKCDHEK